MDVHPTKNGINRYWSIAIWWSFNKFLWGSTVTWVEEMLGKGVLIDREGRTIALIICRGQAEEDTYVPNFCLIAGSPQFWNPIQGMYSQFGSCINPDMMSLKNSLEVWERAICTCPRGTPKAPCWCHETNPLFTRPIPKPCAQAWNLVVEAASLDIFGPPKAHFRRTFRRHLHRKRWNVRTSWTSSQNHLSK
jgi:hypothetical protein